MLWTEIRKWAKENGYESFREKIKDSDNQYEYYWAKIDDSQCSGISTSVTKLAKAIYNEITSHKWVDYQESYISLDEPNNKVSDYVS